MLYIVTPVFNRVDFTRNYLYALKRQTVKEFKIIIVDDGSEDGTSDMIKDEFPDVIILKGNGNLWWAEATNVGIRYALKNNATSIMMLNDDTVPETDYIEKMLHWHKNYPYALLGAFAISADCKKAIYAGQIRNYWTGKSISILDSLKENEMSGLKEVNIFPGRGLLVNVKIFEDIGLFDSKNFPQMVADMDFTTRAYNAGYKIYCNLDAKILIYPDESAGIKLIRDKNIKNFYLHLFSIRGAGNLIWLYKYAFKNIVFYKLPSFLFIGTVSRVLSYFKNQ